MVFFTKVSVFALIQDYFNGQHLWLVIFLSVVVTVLKTNVVNPVFFGNKTINIYFVAEPLPGGEERHGQELGHEDGHVEGERGPKLRGDVHGVEFFTTGST